jgi:hypothetical protein
MRKLWLLSAYCAVALMFSYSPPPARSRLPSLGISHAAAQVFPGHYQHTARRVYRRGNRRAARYGAYAAGATAGHYRYPYGYDGYAGYGGYYGGYGVYGPPFALYTLWLSM